jgi:3'-5' exoribonuclease
MQKTLPLLRLSDLQPGQEADFFALLSGKEALTTRDNKPYFKVTFRDALREVSFPIWADAAFYNDCQTNWAMGQHYKLRAIYRETSYGPQLEIRKLREVTAEDEKDGFDPWMCLPCSRYPLETMFQELLQVAEQEIKHAGLKSLVLDLLTGHKATLLTLPAATRNHHAYVGGFLEHVLSVTRTAMYFADKYAAYYTELKPRLNRDLVVAGAILHDIGKLQEIELLTSGAAYTASGALIGHIVQGRDIVRAAAVGREIERDILLRLEHVILSHQRLPEWGSPKPPMTPEAMLVHYADDLDAKYNMLVKVLVEDTEPGPLTSKKNVLFQQFYRGDGTGE